MSIKQKVNEITIDNVGFSISTYNCLKRAGVLTLRDIAFMTKGELLKVRNLGKTNLLEIANKLNEYSMTLKDEIDVAVDSQSV